jgi:hypothetical protein
LVYPNPVAAGQLLYLKEEALTAEEEQQNAYSTLRLIDNHGRQVYAGTVAELYKGFTAPSVPGVYLLIFEGKAGRKAIKIAVWPAN